MAHTLAAVFDNRPDAERAREALAGAGFDRDCVRLEDSNSNIADASDSAGTSSLGAADRDDDTGFMDSVRNFFADLFGTDTNEHRVYSEAVTRGNTVLIVQVKTRDEIERAADLVEACGPIDIDEQQTQWKSSGWTGAPVTGRVAMHESVSMQSAPGSAQSASDSAQSSSGSAQLSSGSTQTASGGSQQYMAGADTSQRSDVRRAIPVIEEDLKVGKRTVERGGVRVFQRVIETPISEDVSLREEHVKVERHAVDKPVDPEDLKAFKETSFEMRESAEEAVVSKTARVVEEVVIGKEATQHTEHITDKVRRTQVDVEKFGADDDAAFRSHWTSNLAGSGRTYDEYAPAYRYGYSMHGDDTYRGRSWDDVEPTLRRDWETRNPGSAWEHFKAAVRHGWDRLTS
ncbi:MAG TPA: YsnF/AvaK domain-containing protein [Telluria sp.]|nr:YsnF/AvaK domain-containing protein [Telluria sp.]